MPPHCDSMDGPVVSAARKALERRDVSFILPFLPAEREGEVSDAFEKALRARTLGPAAQEVADLYFFETAVRVHRAGEGEPFTGLKPAGLSEGPIIPIAERAIETGSDEELLRALADIVRTEVKKRFDLVMQLHHQASGTVPEAREYVEAMLGLEVFSHKLYQCAVGEDVSGMHHPVHA